jgi:glycosyltransferase involved in cell wall biosynthesis
VRICSPHCGIDPETTSGGETYEREVLRHLAVQGHAIDIVLARHKRYPDGVPNWTIHRLPIGRGMRWPVAAVLLPPIIKRIYRDTGFDLLRAHSLRYIGPAALVARRVLGVDVPIVAHHHHLDPGWLNPVLEGRVMRGVDRVVVGSEFAARQAAAELGVPRDRMAVVYYGVDHRFERRPKSSTLRRRLSLGDGPVVLFLGGLKPRKNLFFLLDVWRDVRRERPDAQLVIAGSGPLHAPLRERASSLGLAESVVFTGFVREDEKVDVYNLADVFFFPSSMEGFGLSVAEAMSCEVPVVISDRGSLPELATDGDGGFVCRAGDARAFTEKILALLADPMLRRKFGAANRERVDRMFRWDHCAAATARVYDEVVHAWRQRRAQAR